MRSLTNIVIFLCTVVISGMSLIMAETTDSPNFQELSSSPLLDALSQRGSRRRIFRPENLPCSRRFLTLCEDTAPNYYNKFLLGLMPQESLINRKPSAPNRRRSGVNIGSFMTDERDGLEEPPEEVLRPAEKRRKNRT